MLGDPQSQGRKAEQVGHQGSVRVRSGPFVGSVQPHPFCGSSLRCSWVGQEVRGSGSVGLT